MTIRRINRIKTLDPSRTGLLRAHMKREFLKRVREIKRELYKLIVDRDILGLKQLKFNYNNDWLNTKAKQVSNLLDWIRQKFKDALLGSEDKSLWERIVSEAFKRGITRSYDDSKVVMKGSKEHDSFQEGKREEFIRSTFAQKAEQEKVKLLSQRVFTDIEGVNEATSVKLARSLADGLTQGKTVKQIASDLSSDITDISEKRLALIAQTELIRAHADGQLSALEKMGANEVGIEVEWTVGKGNVCKRCESHAGRKYTLDEAAGLIPLHPRCKCIWRIL